MEDFLEFQSDINEEELYKAMLDYEEAVKLLEDKDDIDFPTSITVSNEDFQELLDWLAEEEEMGEYPV